MIWRRGYWHYGPHDGRLAWWWVIDGFSFAYSAPVYPYPAYGYSFVSPYEYGPPVVIHPAPYAAQPSAPGPAQQSWYYCANPSGYYPYVGTCPGGWQAVPTTPPPG